LTYDWKRLIKERGRIFALLSFVSFSKLVILVYTGQPVENNTAYARYSNVHQILVSTPFPMFVGPLDLLKKITHHPCGRIRCGRRNVIQFAVLLCSRHDAQGSLVHSFIRVYSLVACLFNLLREVAIDLLEDLCPRCESATLCWI
jgi:hypothetical protein